VDGPPLLVTMWVIPEDLGNFSPRRNFFLRGGSKNSHIYRHQIFVVFLPFCFDFEKKQCTFIFLYICGLLFIYQYADKTPEVGSLNIQVGLKQHNKV
jgi:hypothetical protein